MYVNALCVLQCLAPQTKQVPVSVFCSAPRLQSSSGLDWAVSRLIQWKTKGSFSFFFSTFPALSASSPTAHHKPDSWKHSLKVHIHSYCKLCFYTLYMTADFFCINRLILQLLFKLRFKKKKAQTLLNWHAPLSASTVLYLSSEPILATALFFAVIVSALRYALTRCVCAICNNYCAFICSNSHLCISCWHCSRRCGQIYNPLSPQCLAAKHNNNNNNRWPEVVRVDGGRTKCRTVTPETWVPIFGQL